MRYHIFKNSNKYEYNRRFLLFIFIYYGVIIF